MIREGVVVTQRGQAAGDVKGGGTVLPGFGFQQQGTQVGCVQTVERGGAHSRVPVFAHDGRQGLLRGGVQRLHSRQPTRRIRVRQFRLALEPFRQHGVKPA